MKNYLFFTQVKENNKCTLKYRQIEGKTNINFKRGHKINEKLFI